jgi:hypothetical protein
MCQLKSSSEPTVTDKVLGYILHKSLWLDITFEWLQVVTNVSV